MPVSARYVTLLVLALVGCSDGRRRPPDVEETDVVFPDRTLFDGSSDGGGIDGHDVETRDDVSEDNDDGRAESAVMDGTSMDTSEMETGVDARDGTTATDAGMDGSVAFDGATDDVPVLSICELEAGAAARVCTSDSDCSPMTERCLPSGCGTVRRCQPAGRPCVDDSDCLAGLQRCTRGRCVATGSDCGDTRACPLGFTCEGAPGSRRCVDRRRPCGTGETLCPFNALCYSEPGIDGFCVGVASRCAHDEACLPGTRCRDVDGDGLRECVPDGPCGPGRCDSDGGHTTCEILPVEFVTVCGSHGICSASRPCPAGYTCVDAWGTGVGECHSVSDPCRSHADCSEARTLCYSALPYEEDSGAPGCR